MTRAFLWTLVVWLSMPAHAADWTAKRLRHPGDSSTWTETSTTDSGTLTVDGMAACDNTHATNDVWIYRAPAGTKATAPWMKVRAAGVSCSPDDGETTCSSVLLDSGVYIADPQGTGGAMVCYGRSD